MLKIRQQKSMGNYSPYLPAQNDINNIKNINKYTSQKKQYNQGKLINEQQNLYEDQISNNQIKIVVNSPKKDKTTKSISSLIQTNSTIKQKIKSPVVNSQKSLNKNSALYDSTPQILYKNFNPENQPIKNNEDSAHFYKFWKNKANQYQEVTHNTLKINSQLRRQNQQLTQQNKILKEKIQKLNLKRQQSKNDLNNLSSSQKNADILILKNKQLQIQISKQNQVIKIQQQKIAKQNSKIEELQKYGTENKLLKESLTQMQNKFKDLIYLSKLTPTKTNQLQKNQDYKVRVKDSNYSVTNKQTYKIEIKDKLSKQNKINKTISSISNEYKNDDLKSKNSQSKFEKLQIL